MVISIYIIFTPSHSHIVTSHSFCISQGTLLQSILWVFTIMMYHQSCLLENTIQCDCLYIGAVLTLFTFHCSHILWGMMAIYMALLTAITTWVLTDCDVPIPVHFLNLSSSPLWFQFTSESLQWAYHMPPQLQHCNTLIYHRRFWYLQIVVLSLIFTFMISSMALAYCRAQHNLFIHRLWHFLFYLL